MARRKRKKKAPKKNTINTAHFKPVFFIAIIFLAIMTLFYFRTEDRFWQGYIDSGNQALERGNYEWANKMYNQALQHAQQQGDDNPLIAKTQAHIKRLDKVRNP